MSTVRTYGISGEVAEVLTTEIVAGLLRKAEECIESDSETRKLFLMMKENPEEFHCVVMSTLIFSIGNFDRIPKTEFDAVVRDGVFQDLREVKIPYSI